MTRRNLFVISLASIVLWGVGYLLLLNHINGLGIAAFGVGMGLMAWILGIIKTVRETKVGVDGCNISDRCNRHAHIWSIWTARFAS